MTLMNVLFACRRLDVSFCANEKRAASYQASKRDWNWLWLLLEKSKDMTSHMHGYGCQLPNYSLVKSGRNEA